MAIPYQIANLGEIKALPVESIADVGSHLWLWTTNAFLRQAFDVMEAWGFTYLTTITWVKPSGLGAWFVGTTQHCLFGYYKRCEFKRLRYLPTHFEAIPPEHSAKPGEFYTLVRKVSCEPRIDLFNRRIITGFNGWGDESPYNENARGQVDLFGGVSK
jgi:N6-adenosine-specific RNA methylase IME4